ncbi:MAG: helix-turn-helix domain-containing protein [Thermodesulfobacteriota bacterium]
MSYRWRPYVPVAVRRARAMKELKKLRKKGLEVRPVEIRGRKIARTFWGDSWCDHLESFSDYANRLPRGRTYVRNGSVCHLEITQGQIHAMVCGSELYTVDISINTLPPNRWKEVKQRCAGQIGSLLELLQGRLSENVMSVVTDRDQGLFPLPEEIRLECSCPDWAVMCKHVAAVLYGVGARLDERPELLFLLRGLDHEELIEAEAGLTAAASTDSKGGRRRIADDDLTDVFGIEMTDDAAPAESESEPKSDSKFGPRRRKTVPKPKKTPKAAAKRTVKESAGPPTGKAVAALRAKFGMSQTEFARLLGVSLPTIGNWEKKTGTLHLQTRSLEAWNTTSRMTKAQARRKIKD